MNIVLISCFTDSAAAAAAAGIGGLHPGAAAHSPLPSTAAAITAVHT